MKKDIINNAIKYSNLKGIAGHENNIALAIKEDLQGIGDFEFERDNLGSIAVIKKSKTEGAPTVSISTHMDEIGFMITHIDKKGFVKIEPIGGWWPHNILGQRFTITTRTGEEVIAVAGSKPPHILTPEERLKVAKIEDIYLDTTASSREELESWGVQLGDMVTPYQDSAFVTKQGSRVVGKAHDNRISCVAGIEIMKELANTELDVNLILVGTTQEEVGLRGATTSAFKWTPDIGITIDVTFCYNTPGMRESDTMLGNGPALGMFDRSVIANVTLFDQIREYAKSNNISFGLDWVAGGTDSGKIHLTKDGVVAMTVSIPSRYMHSHNTIIDANDVENTVKLVSGYIKTLNKDVIENIKYK